MDFEFATATRILFGPGRSAEIGTLAQTLGRRALLVVGADPARADSIHDRLAAAEVAVASFPVAGEPSVAMVSRGAELARADGHELVVACGGGSVIDAGKAIAALATNPGDPLEFLEVVGQGRPLRAVPLPFIAIPTTAGTGAEVTRNAVLSVPEQRVKASLRSPLMLPRVALVDPRLTHGLPPALTATTGLDALTQLLEPFVSVRANPMTDALCREGLRRCARSLRRAFRDGEDADAREDMALASLFGGLALANAGLGAVHGFAAPIGGMFPAPHGAVCAALVAPVTRANLAALRGRRPDSPSLARYTEAARLFTGDAEATADDGAEWLARLVADLQIPGLAAHGVTPADLPTIATKAAQASSMKGNPIPLEPGELSAILATAL